jgi:hypothetical protein
LKITDFSSRKNSKRGCSTININKNIASVTMKNLVTKPTNPQRRRAG